MNKSPDAFRTISEVADWLGTPAHVLRFWESKFPQIKPVKRAGGRRYYRPADMLLLGGLKRLLHEDGMTIRGAQKLLREEGIRHVSAMSQPLEGELQADYELDDDAYSDISSAPEPVESRAPEPPLTNGADKSPAPVVLGDEHTADTETVLEGEASAPDNGLADADETPPPDDIEVAPELPFGAPIADNDAVLQTATDPEEAAPLEDDHDDAAYERPAASSAGIPPAMLGGDADGFGREDDLPPRPESAAPLTDDLDPGWYRTEEIDENVEAPASASTEAPDEGIQDLDEGMPEDGADASADAPEDETQSALPPSTYLDADLLLKTAELRAMLLQSRHADPARLAPVIGRVIALRDRMAQGDVRLTRDGSN
ncbi:MAG: MerR family transcriptional regulator [Pseudomonadota bacterium]